MSEELLHCTLVSDCIGRLGCSAYSARSGCSARSRRSGRSSFNILECHNSGKGVPRVWNFVLYGILESRTLGESQNQLISYSCTKYGFDGFKF
jgi:hypothetical protein